MIRTLVVVLACTIPAIAFASADDKSTTTSVLHWSRRAWARCGLG
jgi:hypothetical protein